MFEICVSLSKKSIVCGKIIYFHVMLLCVVVFSCVVARRFHVFLLIYFHLASALLSIKVNGIWRSLNLVHVTCLLSLARNLFPPNLFIEIFNLPPSLRTIGKYSVGVLQYTIFHIHSLYLNCY